MYDPAFICSQGRKSPKIKISTPCFEPFVHPFPVQFSPVKLNSGTWQQALMQLCTLPRLLDFRTSRSGYSWRHGLAPQLPPYSYYCLNIETVNPLDRCALGNLQRQVNANRIVAGFPPFTELDYQYIDQLPLETAMQYLERYRQINAPMA